MVLCVEEALVVVEAVVEAVVKVVEEVVVVDSEDVLEAVEDSVDEEAELVVAMLLEVVVDGGHCLHSDNGTLLRFTERQTGLVSSAGAFGSGEK